LNNVNSVISLNNVSFSSSSDDKVLFNWFLDNVNKIISKSEEDNNLDNFINIIDNILSSTLENDINFEKTNEFINLIN
jgi:hypothetical protein